MHITCTPAESHAHANTHQHTTYTPHMQLYTHKLIYTHQHITYTPLHTTHTNTPHTHPRHTQRTNETHYKSAACLCSFTVRFIGVKQMEKSSLIISNKRRHIKRLFYRTSARCSNFLVRQLSALEADTTNGYERRHNN